VAPQSLPPTEPLDDPLPELLDEVTSELPSPEKDGEAASVPASPGAAVPLPQETIGVARVRKAAAPR
jgi:hypothetical protein